MGAQLARIQAQEATHDAESKRDTGDDDQDHLFEMIENWPERYGTPEWRKRAHRELDGPVHGAFIAYTNSKKELSDEEKEADCPEYELFNATRIKLIRRRKSFYEWADALDSFALIATLFGALGLFMWVFSSFEAGYILLFGNVAVLLVWAIVRAVRWRNDLQEKRKLRFSYQRDEEYEGEASSSPLTHADDRIPALEFEGRKYRSNRQLNKAMHESQERQRKQHAGEEALNPGTKRVFEWIINIFIVVTFLGLLGILEGGGEGHAPMWLSIVLMVLGGIGFFLAVRLRDRLRAADDRYYSSELRWFDEAGNPSPISPPSPSLPRE